MKENQFNTFKTLVSNQIEIIKNMNEVQQEELHGATIELLTIVSTTKALTNLKEEKLIDYIENQTGLMYSEILNIEEQYYHI
ncbi:hypothetical protein [Staphylococcus agnetis]|uniref:Phage protein n=1 Tax=Staphylococcus agnetis TaxID=985762 RepID=A0ABX3Z246_9STAP|nr:hypothetical protein [Staphylococcus agnetis]MDG4943957.1 hypothetical protein [Staphylococcus agnetis]OSP22613.1 hypothetical protein B9L42_00605 [Staphylococcus agnetis]OSP23096.1 hypothetical protein B9M87_09190 [Staphylococcus agnetis]OTW30493.1 hypothetical protein B9M88_09500 [Staphylococcus agnetis]